MLNNEESYVITILLIKIFVIRMIPLETEWTEGRFSDVRGIFVLDKELLET